MKFMKVFLACLLALVVSSILTFLFWLFVILGVAGSMETVVAVHPNSILKIDFKEMIVDAPSIDPFASIDFSTMQTTRRLPLLKVLRSLETAKTDDRIEGIYLRLNGEGGVQGTAILEELRAALADFKTSGKFVIAYNETYSQGSYYLASVADKIYMQPEGGMDWSGLSMNIMFYKGLFDKLDLKPEVFRPTECKYKSAVEPYIMDKMSDANREQMQTLANSLWGTITQAVSEARHIDVKELNALADKLEVSLPEDALKHKLVDGLVFEDQMKEVFHTYGVEPDTKGDYQFVTLGEYVSQTGADLKNISASQVAVLYADGGIVDGEGNYGNNIFGNTLAAKIATLRQDEQVKAVVLRVNSPGGSALASDVIWRELELLRAVKPLIVSMGSYAASGGYYISCPADAILADRMTLTGSIGVFGMYLNTVDALKNKLGITIDGVKTNTSAGMGSTGALTPAERASVMRGVDKVYTTFTGHVAQGRNLPIEKVLDIAGGRVWTGADALPIGLIDSYGGLRDAIAVAVDKAELGEDYRVVEVTEEPEGLAAFFSTIFAEAKMHIESSELGVMMREYRKVQEATRQTGIVMYEPRTFVIE